MKTKTLALAMTICVTCVLGLTLLTPITHAIGMPSSGSNSTSAQDEYELIETVTTWVLGITGFVAVLMIIFGGFRYITSAGNNTQMEAAKNILIKSIFGLVIVVVAYVIVRAVITALGGTAEPTN